MIVVTELWNTCTSCPSQWEGKTSDGRWVYCRLRGGYFTASVGATVRDAVLSTLVDGHEGLLVAEDYDAYELNPAELNALCEGHIEFPFEFTYGNPKENPPTSDKTVETGQAGDGRKGSLPDFRRQADRISAEDER